MSDLVRKPVIALPDPTDMTLQLDDKANSLTSALSDFGNGRPIVIAAGFIQRSKGILDLLSVVSDLPNFAFVLAGQIHWKSFNEDEVYLINCARNLENVFVLDRRLSDSELDSAISTSSAVFAAYIDFPHSSNIICKAAHYKVPVIVRDGYLMAERVRKYALGAIIADCQNPNLPEAVRECCAEKWRTTNQPKWEQYLSDHSWSNFSERTNDLLNACEV